MFASLSSLVAFRVLQDCISLLPSFQPKLIHGHFTQTARFYPVLHVCFHMPTLSFGLNSFSLLDVFTIGYVSGLGIHEVLDHRAHNPLKCHDAELA